VKLVGAGIEIGEPAVNGQALLPSCEILQGLALVQLEGTVVQLTESPCAASQLVQMGTAWLVGISLSSILLSCPGVSRDFRVTARGWILLSLFPE
jgi:hypothetical protein